MKSVFVIGAGASKEANLPTSSWGEKSGAEVNGRELMEIAKRLKTFTEGVDAESSEIVAIRQSVAMSDGIVFLGFYTMS